MCFLSAFLLLVLPNGLSSRAYTIRGRCGQFFSWKLMCDDFLIYLTHGAKIIQMTYIPYSAQPPKLQVCLAKRLFKSIVIHYFFFVIKLPFLFCQR